MAILCCLVPVRDIEFQAPPPAVQVGSRKDAKAQRVEDEIENRSLYATSHLAYFPVRGIFRCCQFKCQILKFNTEAKLTHNI